MNESIVLQGAGMETSRLLSITQQRDAGVLAGDRAFNRNDAALGVLLGGVCLGGVGLILVMFALCCKRLGARHLTVFKVSLIFTDLLQMLSTPAAVLQLVGSICHLKHCHKLLIVWLASRRCGVLLHLLVALEFILTNQSCESTKIVLPYLSVPVLLTIDLICILFFDVTEAAVSLGAMAIALILFTLKARCSSRSTTKPFNQVLCLALLSFGATYCPSFVMECMILNKVLVSVRLYDIFLCLTNLRLVTDAYLCWVTCRETAEEAPLEMEVQNPDFAHQVQL
ncbi:uncharacterized protein LOC111661682 [Seriola lalandi dorsalis]|uniref:uncharacterized protein LOC111661682 n=1 Tax=Seriola lalandi dorsalis TaxID=1841481 RepID=UPI000C6F8787|nr:uncharacterized protein LOC111661682 [Seriola lalandi dorsalis]